MKRDDSLGFSAFTVAGWVVLADFIRPSALWVHSAGAGSACLNFTGHCAHAPQNSLGDLLPWGVDVATGVEGEGCRKDPEKMARFVEAVRDAENFD